MADKPNLFFRIIRYEPGVSLGQWTYDRIIGNWQTIVALVGFAVSYYTASVSPLLAQVGPFGWWVIALGIFIVLYVILTVGARLRSRTRLNDALAAYTKRKEITDQV